MECNYNVYVVSLDDKIKLSCFNSAIIIIQPITTNHPNFHKTYYTLFENNDVTGAL